ncbi:MAG: hypothetical protein ABIG63_19925 [Chloroflexota bacterium]
MGLFPRNINDFLVLQGIPRGPNSQVFFVDPASGSNSNPGTNFLAPLASIEAAYALCVANQHDVVLYVAGASGNTLAAAVTWSKSYTHLIGWCAPTMVGQRSRIFQAAALTGASPLLTVSGSGCIFKNIYIFQGVNDATSLINVAVTGGRNYFENVHFAGGGHAAQAIDGGASLQLNGGSENTFIDCTIGVDTIAAATGMVGLLVDGSATRNIFKGCNFTMWGGNSGAAFVEFTDITAIDRYLIFKDCNFINLGTGQASAFVIPAGFDGTNMRVFLRDCALFGATDWDASNRGAIQANMGTFTGGGNSGLFAASASV